jgi:23S rRNA pseudouridine2605 synthase
MMENHERLNKVLAHAGVGSRRHCDDLILAGRVAVDGQVVRELGTRIDPEQQIAVDGKPLRGEPLVYWLVHKPRGYLCTNHDPAGRPLAIDLLGHVPQRVYTVGRLDEDSEGLLLMTNDGDLAHRLMHPRYGVRKKYLVQVAGKPRQEDLDKLTKGVWLSDGFVKAQAVRRLRPQGESTWLEIVLSEGKNREIRRMLARLGHKVMRLRRTALGPLHLDRLPAGKSRRLRPEEVARLREVAERCGGDPGTTRRRKKRKLKPVAASVRPGKPARTPGSRPASSDRPAGARQPSQRGRGGRRPRAR